jgi:chromosome segregation ATPase
MGPSASELGFGPSRSGSGAPSSGAPYLDPPSIELDPNQIDDALGAGPSGHSDYQPSRPRSSGPPPSYRESSSGDDVHVPSHLTAEQLRVELHRALRRNEALAHEVDDLRYNASPGAAHSSEDREQVRRTEGENRRMRADIAALREETEDFRTEDGRLRAQMDALTDRNVELKEQISQIQGTQGELRDRLRDAREDLDGALFKRDELLTDVERLEKDKVDLFDQLTKLKIEYNHMERSYEQNKKEHNLLEFEYKRLDENSEELERELRNLLEGDEDQIDALNKLQAIVDEKEALVKELRGRIGSLKEDIEDSGSEEHGWLVEVETLKRDSERLTKDRAELQARVDDLRDDLASSKARAASEHEEADEELVSLIDENERLKRRLKDSVSTGVVDSVSVENAELRRENQKLTDALTEAKSAQPASSSELLDQLKELTTEKRKLERKLREHAALMSTNSGTPAGDVTGFPVGKAKEVFANLNSMVSGWRANLEAMQIHVGDMTSLFKDLTGSGGLDEEAAAAVEEADPEWACESMEETVKQILDDSKKIKNMLLELRDQI